MSSPISTPKGGGAVSGLGEKFSPDLFTGTGNFSIPIALPPGRNGFQPELGLQYSTGSGNSPFGLGWSLSVPGVMRKTAKGVPAYDDEKDTFILSGAEDLVAVERFLLSSAENKTGIIPLQNEEGVINQYRPRTEGLFARIYHLKTNLRNCWKVMSKNGLISWYGSKQAFDSDLSLVQKPGNSNSIFAWKLTLTEDPFGNHIVYTYEKENVRDNDYHRWDQNYLSEVKYADYPIGNETRYMVCVRFNYKSRVDAYSDYKCGFNIRTTQRCETIQIFTNPQDGEIKTRTYHFQYSDELLPVSELPYNAVSLLCKVEVEGHDEAKGTNEFLPPLEFRYSHFKPKQQKFKQLQGNEMPLASLANPGFELIDLFGNGLPDIVQINGVVRYWRNMGDGKFDIPRLMKEAPTGVNLGDPDVQLVDANGDGRTDLLVNGTNLSGYFSMKHNASWDTKAFKKYQYAPSFSFADPEVKMLDLTGDGVTDALRNGSSFECFFHDKNKGWEKTKRVPKRQLEDFPNVSFADPRIKLADMSGDGLQDIVQVNSGSIKYWPNVGYGNFAKPVVMKNSPRFDYPFDPARLQLADIDGDGQADLIYIDTNKITFWINQSGNAWSEPFEIAGTPFVTNLAGVRVVDLYGSGVSGIMYSFDSPADTQRHRWFFLDLTGGTKPYLLHEMDNNMGALTRVSYLPSTRYYLADQYGMSPFSAESKRVFAKRKPWKTTLPFPVQVVSRVEVIDELSKGKLTTEYIYHHGYWDGGEREFRGFGRVDQRDTETFQRYNTSSAPALGTNTDSSFNSSFVSADAHELEFEQVQFEHYSPPIETRNFFHLGPIGDEFGDWMEIDFSDEYWKEDPNILTKEPETFYLLQNLPRRAKRDAIRAWRGSSLRSELYALDELDADGNYIAGQGERPYTVSESQYGIRLEAAPAANLPLQWAVGGANELSSPLGTNVLVVPKETSGYVFFSFAVSSRTTQWERGYDPMTQFSFTTGYDAYGQPCKQLSAALPRGIQPPYNIGTGTSPVEEGNRILSTCSVTAYAQRDDAASAVPSLGGQGVYIVDRTCKAISYEVIQQFDENVFDLKTRVFGATLPTEVGNVFFPIIGFSLNYYDAPEEFGPGLALGQLGKYGAAARSETLVLTEDILLDAYGTKPEFFKFSPETQDFSAYPADFVSALQDVNLGYKKYLHSTNANYASGYYAESGRTKYDWQNALNPNPKGLVLATKDIFNAWAEIEYDAHLLLPTVAKQHLSPFGVGAGTDYLATTATYDYRVMQAKMVTDPNGNRAVFDFSPLGLLLQSGVIGKPGANEGDIITESPFAYKPSVLMDYDFFAFKEEGNPVWVKTIQREKHYQQDPNSPEIVKVEYTDGFGRLLQTRAQAEDVIFGDPVFGSSGLPEDQSAPNQDAVGVERGANDPLNVVVSGWKIYNNKGKVVEQYEPYFDKGFDYDNAVVGVGEKIRMFYDPQGNVIRTVNPDNSEQWVIHGKPDALNSVAVKNSWSFEGYEPTPWESYTYDANDLGGVTHPNLGAISSHWYTPANSVVDQLGRAIKTTSRLDNNTTNNEVVMKYSFDIQGNLLSTIDPLGRIVFKHKYGLAKQLLWKEHLDSGVSNAMADVAGKPIEATDAKGARVYTGYDALSRPEKVWAQDNGSEAVTLRQVSVYAEALGLSTAANLNLLGKIYQHYDESGLNQIVACDFKGNPLEKFKRVISDDELLAAGTTGAYTVDWTGLDTGILDGKDYVTTVEYDALNRGVWLQLPEDYLGNRGEIEPVFNRAGALEGIKKDGTEYVKRIAYNAKGQQLLAVWNNDVMMRFAYDSKTFRLKRIKAEKYDDSVPLTYEPQSGTTRYDQHYVYDLVGNILAVNDATPDCGITGSEDELQRLFKYDALYRLIYAKGREDNSVNNLYWVDPPQATAPNANNCRLYVQKYEYDKVGNIQNLIHTASGNNFTRHYNYQSGNNKVASIDDGQGPPTTIASYSYDANGSQITANTERFYEWNYADRMRCFYIQAGMTISKFAHYVYDAGGARTKKLVIDQYGNYESVTYIGGVLEYHKRVTDSGSTVEEKNYIQLQGGIEIRIGDYADDDTDYTLYTISDYVSSAAIRLKDNGALYDKEEYYPYGDSSLRTFGKKRYRYTGMERDNESGLYYMNARYYCSGTAKFLSVDPLAGKNSHESSYCYAACNPVMKNDPTGMTPGGAERLMYDSPTETGHGADVNGIKKNTGGGQNAVVTNQWQNASSNTSSFTPPSSNTTYSGVPTQKNPYSFTPYQPILEKKETTPISTSTGLLNAINNTLNFLPDLAYNVFVDVVNLPITTANIIGQTPEFLNETLPQTLIQINNTNPADVLWNFQNATIDNSNFGSDFLEVATNPDSWVLPVEIYIGSRVLSSGGGAAPSSGSSGGSSRYFYTVQSAEDAARLKAGGDPWPTTPSRAHFGEGVYAWGTMADAAQYSELLAARGATQLQVLQFSVSEAVFTEISCIDLTVMTDAEIEAWLSRNSILYGQSTSEYQYVIRATGNFGNEHFFSQSVFPHLKF